MMGFVICHHVSVSTGWVVCPEVMCGALIGYTCESEPLREKLETQHNNAANKLETLGCPKMVNEKSIKKG